MRRGCRLRSSSSRPAHSPAHSTPITASRDPSGDHSASVAPRAKEVTTAASPPSAGMTATWAGFPSSPVARRKARRVPSGDHRGRESTGPWVKARASAPSHSQTCLW